MNASIKRRISVSSCWASTRIAFLDSLERYEDSYAITQEFREWITCLGENSEQLKDSVLMIPKIASEDILDEISDPDEALEI